MSTSSTSEAAAGAAALGLTAVPGHVAVIMDGNGRWAETRGLSRIRGHEAGAETVREITRECARLGVRELTLYAFSNENWKRPADEIGQLMGLLERYLVGERREIMENRIRFAVIGRTSVLPPGVRAEMDRTIAMSRDNGGMILRLALNYGGRAEIVDAARRFAAEVAAGRAKPDDLDEEGFARRLYDPGMSEPDLLIRTAGEMRISNFLLWQVSYSEFWVTPVTWPEFRAPDLHEAFRDYARRERRFGGLPPEGRNNQ